VTTPPADLATQLATYAVGSADANPPTEPVPQTFTDSRVTALIDASEYFADLQTELASIGTGANAAANAGHFILVAGWWLGLEGGSYIPATRLGGGSGAPDDQPSITGKTLLSIAVPSVVTVTPLTIDAPNGSTKLIDLLKTKAQAGVDVRVLGWAHPGVMGTVAYQALGALKNVARINSLTMKSIKELRSEPKIGNKAVLNVIAHTAGGVHTKIVVLGTPTRWIAYTGGIDLEPQRWGDADHHVGMTWHDVVAKVEGPAVQALYDWFKDMWTENIPPRSVRHFKFEGQTMDSFMTGVPALAAATAPTPASAVGQTHVQSLRTVPKMNYTTLNCLPTNSPISFVSNGLFEVHTALKKALTKASSYVYIEDQSFWAQETLGFVNQAIKANSSLHVVLLTSGAVDPNDPAFPFSYLTTAINHGLLDGLDASQVGRVRLFKRLGDINPVTNDPSDTTPIQITVKNITGAGRTVQAQTDLVMTDSNGQPTGVLADALAARNLFLLRPPAALYPILGNTAATPGAKVVLTVEQPPQHASLSKSTYGLVFAAGVTVHTKSVIVDDVWTMIGSANTMRRSLYTDLEQSVSVIDGDTANPFPKQYRTRLWAHHLGGAAGDYDDLDQALHVWDTDWGTAGLYERPPQVRNLPLPLTPDAAMTASEKSKYDWYNDPDSRDAWGGLCPPT
jgi:phosphatidylserine/phosphatidylglycerophosphate/cardiolipin synthase-like enzyme